MQNQEVEATLNTVNIDGKFRRVTINAAYNQNKILNIQGQIMEGGFGPPQRSKNPHIKVRGNDCAFTEANYKEPF